jgi:DNA-binding IclR family transcriptional regulator
VTHGEREDGLSVVSVPVAGDDGVVAALAVAGPTDRFTRDKVARFLNGLTSAASIIEQSTFMAFIC